MTHPVLVRLRSGDASVRRAACAEAADDSSAALWIEALGDALGDADPDVSRAACDALVRIARVERTVHDVVRAALRSANPQQRFAAAVTSARIETPGPHLVPALVGALASRGGETRWAAARLLVDVGRLHGEVLGILLGLLRGGESPLSRRMAAFCLRELAPDDPAAALALVAASRDPELHVRRAALATMAALLDPPGDVARRLVEVLDRDPDPSSRHIAAMALGELGAPDPAALPAGTRERLERLAAQDDADLRRAATRALARLAGRSAETRP